ncbi:urease accessory protein UreD [Streptomyces cocklensis]|jgi:urease accessory protein|uniref:Urease accessory protein UreD n=1 Tax=Actinacidiphila cocklensis TaxID=887465 RepID=A0A9W4DSN5_9ACTN|nr:urease accessory protein UreD [Actinacidiphila cocklensis]MDD1059728.1 urease accessory protein UreD [Actinacidiphila cocklensis]WSX72600.1 urease accessory protein UreD [Streptomyces sp. NBC_00899]WSX81331.1 urease accessory protein UreD [Streptomyces sp. NBC_00899]CAG6397002.1 Urease accessory protein UreD 3 [Actinacidiphila cocklensis]
MTVTSTARIGAVRDRSGGTALPVLAGAGALALRRTRASRGGEARVTVVGAMSAPLGGDRLRIDVDVAAGARLTVDSAAATVSLPDHEGRPAFYDVRLTVGEGAELRWLPEPVIAAGGSDLRMTTRVRLAAGARLVLREELVLGRHGEAPGHLTTRLTVDHDGRTLLDQALAFGPGAAPGWDGPAVLGGHRTLGQLLLVPPPDLPADLDLPPLSSLTPLAAGPALLLTSTAPRPAFTSTAAALAR